MAKKFANASADEAFRRTFGIVEEDTKELSSFSPMEPSVSGPDKAGAKASKRVDHIGRKFYLTPEIYSALNRRAYREPDLDLSAHVRAALELYLAEDLTALRNGQF